MLELISPFFSLNERFALVPQSYLLGHDLTKIIVVSALRFVLYIFFDTFFYLIEDTLKCFLFC